MDNADCYRMLIPCYCLALRRVSGSRGLCRMPMMLFDHQKHFRAISLIILAPVATCWKYYPVTYPVFLSLPLELGRRGDTKSTTSYALSPLWQSPSTNHHPESVFVKDQTSPAAASKRMIFLLASPILCTEPTVVSRFLSVSAAKSRRRGEALRHCHAPRRATTFLVRRIGQLG